MSAYIAARHDEFGGVALICRILRSATPGILIACDYRAARTRPPSDRKKIRGEQLIADVREVDRQTTVTDLGATRRADLVNRAFKAPASTRLWGAPTSRQYGPGRGVLLHQIHDRRLRQEGRRIGRLR